MRTKALLVALTLALSAPVAAMAQTAPAAAPAPSSIVELRPDDRIVGSMDAPVTLTTYVSTTCGHCANWHNTVLPTLMARYVETGQVRIVYRDLPTPPQDVAAAGAVMARCVPADKFDAALGALYHDQGILRAANEEEMHRNAMVWLAGAGVAGGLTREQMNNCFDDEANWTALEARINASHTDGVTGTPTFFVNGVRADIDSRDLTAFDAAIQPQLAAH